MDSASSSDRGPRMNTSAMGWCRLLGADLIGLQAFVSFDDDKGDWLAIVQASSASALDIAEVNEKIFTIFSGIKPYPFLVLNHLTVPFS